jgi:hypothetical protein
MPQPLHYNQTVLAYSLQHLQQQLQRTNATQQQEEPQEDLNTVGGSSTDKKQR